MPATWAVHSWHPILLSSLFLPSLSSTSSTSSQPLGYPFTYYHHHLLTHTTEHPMHAPNRTPVPYITPPTYLPTSTSPPTHLPNQNTRTHLIPINRSIQSDRASPSRPSASLVSYAARKGSQPACQRYLPLRITE
ncbi:hypothetical protein JOL62DRAFT_144011 [Phyllosticta paracitricarpa]|uniref:Uncharacterized protein n=1 Tax=Phyllosticta paracitricarpa TaxID=2016321 RepID=A0ABR1NJ01_9PEZI